VANSSCDGSHVAGYVLEGAGARFACAAAMRQRLSARGGARLS
jgi:hypothetical protein